MRALVMGMLGALAIITQGGGANATTPAGESVRGFVNAVERTVPAAMARTRTVGLSLAIVIDGRVVYDRGFGLRNAYTGAPVLDTTVFDAASHGKPVTAAIALRLAEEGRLDLDRPLSTYLEQPFLDNELAKQITARQVLSHSSGLPNRIWEHVDAPDFAPGTRFSYSGNGYNYLQHVMERISGDDLQTLAQREVFGPLAMTGTSFVPAKRFSGRVAAGHVPAPAAVSPYLRVLLFALVGALLMAVMWKRLRTGTWWPDPAPLLFFFAVGGVLGILPFAQIFDAPAVLLWGAIGLAIFALAAIVCLLLLALAGRLADRAPVGTVIGLAAILAAIGVAHIAAQGALLPVPIAGSAAPRASTSLRSNAGDLARLLIAEMRPGLLNAKTLAEAQQPQVEIDRGMAWGLGYGLERPGDKQMIWQWGENPGSQSLSVGRPDVDAGIVVMTTGPEGLVVARELASRFFGVQGRWALQG